MLTNLLRGVTWLSSTPSKGPARLITWSEISALIDRCVAALDAEGAATEESWLLSVLYQHLAVTAVTLDSNTAPSVTLLHRRVIRSVVQHLTRVADQGQHLPLLRGTEQYTAEQYDTPRY